MHVDLLFDHYFNFLSVKSDITKRESNQYVQGSQKLLKTQITLIYPGVLEASKNPNNFNMSRGVRSF